MLLQPTISKPPLHLHTHQNHVSPSSTLPHSISFASGLLQNSAYSLKQAVVFTSRTYKNPVFITRSSISQVHNYGTVDYENRPVVNWHAIYKRIFLMQNPEMGSASVLNQVENEGKNISKWEICRIVRELRKSRRFKYALEVYQWMNNRGERYRITSSDTAIQLDLISKVHGIPQAEEYFAKLSDALKDKRVYGSLLNAYVRARLKEKAESLFGRMRTRGYISHALPLNVMMTLYMNLKDYEKVESMISEMMERNVSMDIYSYNIWLSTCGARGSIEKLDQVFEQMEMNPNVNPNWTTFSTMTSIYLKLGQLEKASHFLKKVESKITGRFQRPFHNLMGFYGNLGMRDDVYRIWNMYKTNFASIVNSGYLAVMSSLVKLDDEEGAEKIYSEWLSVKSFYDIRIGNVLLGNYVRKGLSEKAEMFFSEMIEEGGKPNPKTWEILSENRIKSRRISDALSCMMNAVSAAGPWRSWRPKPLNVFSILKICEEDADVASKDALMEILKKVRCLDDESYMSVCLSNGTGAAMVDVEANGDDDVSEEDNVALQESL